MSWQLIQQETFTNWVNSHIAKNGLKCADLTKDLSNGLQVIALLENLTNKSLGKYNKTPRVPFQKLENLQIALKFCEAEGVKLVNISGEDICGGDLKLILGFIWTLFQHWAYAKNKQELLDWIRTKIPEYNINNFTTDWSDGRAICALVNAIGPGLIPDHKSMDPKNAVANAGQGIQAACDHFDVPKIMSPKHMCAKTPDEKSTMMYLSYFPKAKRREIKAPSPAPEQPKAEVSKPAEPKAAAAASKVEIAPAPAVPAPVAVKEKINYALQSIAHGPGLHQPVVNKLAKFTIETPNKPEQGPVKAKIKAGYEVALQDKGKGIFAAEYTPKQVGEIQVEVTVGDEHVPGSPFTATVLQEISLGGEGKIRGFYSTTHGFAQDRKNHDQLQVLLEMKKIHLRPNFEPWVPVDIMDPMDRDALYEKSGTKKLPQIYIDDKFVGGFEEFSALEEAGKLDALLRMDLYHDNTKKTTAI